LFFVLLPEALKKTRSVRLKKKVPPNLEVYVSIRSV
jgi:hypothetical protein